MTADNRFFASPLFALLLSAFDKTMQNRASFDSGQGQSAFIWYSPCVWKIEAV